MRAHRSSPAPDASAAEAGFLLLAVIVMVFLVLLTLSVAAPRIARSIQRDREQETEQRAHQYTRAIQLYYRKFRRYPSSIEDLKKSNNQRFLRQEYVDPLTGKKDWRLIHVGENKTQVKGFFGEDLPGLAGPTGLSSVGGTGTGSSSIGTSGASGSAAGGGGFSLGGSGSSFGNGSSFGGGASSGLGATSGTSSGAAGGGMSGAGGNTSGVASQSATSFNGSGGGAIMGVGVPKEGEALLTVNEQTSYNDWEFLYDPRIEQLKARATLLGGVNSANGTSSTPGIGTPVAPLGSGSMTGTGAGSTNSGTSTPASPTTPP